MSPLVQQCSFCCSALFEGPLCESCGYDNRPPAGGSARGGLRPLPREKTITSRGADQVGRSARDLRGSPRDDDYLHYDCEGP